MSVLTMSLSAWGKKAGNITAILILAGIVGAYINSLIPNYALASDLKSHIESSDKRYAVTFISEKERQIRVTGDEIALYQLDRASRALTPREALHEAQLINRKAAMLLEIEKLNPR